MRKTFIATLLICAVAVGAEAQTGDDAAFEAFNRRANDKGDCSGYQAMADAALAGRPGGSLVHRVSATAAICAARDGRLDLTDRLIARFPTSSPGFRDYLVATPYQFMIRRLVDIPGAGPLAFAAARRWPDIDPVWSPNNQRSELMAMAAFAADEGDAGLKMLGETGRQTALSVQVDRRFRPAWHNSASLDATLDHPPVPPKVEPNDAWRWRLIDIERTGDDVALMAEARRSMLNDAGDGADQRTWIVARHIEAGRLDAASAALDLDHPGPFGVRDFRVLDSVIQLVSALILADRVDEARQWIDRWSRLDDLPTTPEGVPIEYESNKNADPRILPIQALKARLAATPPTRLEPGDWWLALICGYPEDQTAALLLAALNEPFYRNQALQALNLPPRYSPMGKADQDYRLRRDALLARPDVAAAVERYGRRLPPALAWRLSRANLPF